MSFDISTNRIQHGLLTPDERRQMEDAAKVPGALVVWSEGVYDNGELAWLVTNKPSWTANMIFRVHLPAGAKPEPAPAKPEPKLEYWRHKDDSLVCKAKDGVIVEVNGNSAFIDDEPLIPNLWLPITESEYEAAKPAPTEAKGKDADIQSALDHLAWATSDASPLAEAASIAFDQTHSTAAMVCWLKCRKAVATLKQDAVNELTANVKSEASNDR